MDEVCPSFLLQGRHGLQKAFHAMPRLQCLAHMPADNLLGVVVGYHGQVAEGILVITYPDRDVCDIRHPYLVLAAWDEILDEVRIRGQPMGGIRRTGPFPW